MNKSVSFIDEYKKRQSAFKIFAEKLEKLITELLVSEEIKYHQLTHRIKSEESLRKKISIKGEKYESLSNVTDLIGLRIVTYFEDEVDRIAKFVNTEFEIDYSNSIDKRNLDADKFGYRSLHYIVALKSPRNTLAEWRNFKDLKVEIQIRSILQHAWAEIEHDIGYKGSRAIPQHERRNFFRIAALLETADKDFIMLRNNLTQYEEKIPELIKDTPTEVLLDKASLTSYKKSSAVVERIDKRIAVNTGIGLIEEADSYDFSLAEKLSYIGIQTIKELDDNLKKYEDLSVAIATDWLDKSNYNSIVMGISMFYLPYAILIETAEFNSIVKYFKDNNLGANPLGDANKLLATYQKIKESQ